MKEKTIGMMPCFFRFRNLMEKSELALPPKKSVLGAKLETVCICHLKTVNLKVSKLITSHGPNEKHHRRLISNLSGLERSNRAKRKASSCLVPYIVFMKKSKLKTETQLACGPVPS